MRQIVLDTETTGLDAKEHRIIEIACLEMESRVPTGRSFHHYFNPEREIDPEATKVHGFTWESLKQKPLFAGIAHEFIEFITGAELLAHNAPFDVAFLNEEMARINLPPIEKTCAKITDTLTIARRKHTGRRNDLDTLCRRYGVDNTARDLHGAMLDAQLLMRTYLLMTGGQSNMELAQEYTAPTMQQRQDSTASNSTPEDRSLKIVMATEAERELHAAIMARICQ
ncbi:MAG: DNA polymerase III subunit epsilon [Candidatus Eutrophobiaceae bacterium]